jgi:hypothetical protein
MVSKHRVIVAWLNTNYDPPKPSAVVWKSSVPEGKLLEVKNQAEHYASREHGVYEAALVMSFSMKEKDPLAKARARVLGVGHDLGLTGSAGKHEHGGNPKTHPREPGRFVSASGRVKFSTQMSSGVAGIDFNLPLNLDSRFTYVPFHRLLPRDKERARGMYPHKRTGGAYDFRDEHYYYPVKRDGTLPSVRGVPRELAIPLSVIKDDAKMRALGYTLNPGWFSGAVRTEERLRQAKENIASYSARHERGENPRVSRDLKTRISKLVGKK